MEVSASSLISIPDHCPWGIAVLAHSTGRVLAANEYMQKIYGCKESASLTDLFSLSIETSLAAKLESFGPGDRWSGRIYPQSNRYGISSVEVMFERSSTDPEQVWLYMLEHPMVNEKVRFSSRSELKMLRVLLDNTLEYVFFRDIKGHFILANEAFSSAVVFEEKLPSVETRMDDFVSAKSAAWMESLDLRMFESGRPVVNEVSLFVFKNGTTHWLQITSVPVRNGEGSIIGSLSVARDISDLKRTESDLRTAIAKAHEASRAKGDFLAAMSHEIRTPINGIIGASELCRETALDIEQRGYLETVIQCGSTLLSLVNDVLDFSKIEAGQLNLESLNFNPRNLIESVAEEFAPAARAKDIELVVGFDAELPEYLLGDPTRVKQVFYNLVGNAVKFTEAGEITVRAEVANLTRDSVRVLFSVSDTGIGISKDRQDAIFSSFTQADMTTTRKYGGSGLGLSICKELVRLMQGSIHVTSELERGARFQFELPFQIANNPGAYAVPFNAELAGMRVLIVDDNQTNCELYQQMCSGWGYRSQVAIDGVAGLAAMEVAVREGDAFRLVLLDQQMPGLTGLDLASLVCSRPDLRNVKIILLSSSLNREESERANEIGIARALAKPVRRATLQEVILETFGVGGSAIKPSQPPSFSNSSEAQSLAVLLVEDNPINQDLASRRLKKLGHQVTLAEDGQKAVDWVKQASFDCILMDIQMPGMDGFEATRTIRQMEQDSDLPPQYIIAMTAHALKGDRERCLQSGMDNYIPKPFRAEVLKEVLAQASQSLSERQQSAGLPGSQCAANHCDRLSERLKLMDAEDSEDVLASAPMFLKAFPQDINKLQAALVETDFKKCYFIAHTLKGVSGIFGDLRCMQFAKDVEAACRVENKSALNASATSLIQAMQQLGVELEALIS
jgi:PAS domain S-box-containing protein